MARLLSFAAAYVMVLVAPSAIADALPPPEEYSALQQRLMGVWQETTCIRTKHRDGHGCARRIIGVGETSFSLLTYDHEAQTSFRSVAEQTKWSEVSASGDTATIAVKLNYFTEMSLTFPGPDTLILVGNGDYEDAEFKRIMSGPRQP